MKKRREPLSKDNKNNVGLESTYARLISDLLTPMNIKYWKDAERRNLPTDLINAIPSWSQAIPK